MATCVPALAIALSYMLIVVMANGLGVLIVMTLHRFGQAAVGSPPVAQVTVDVLGILLTCLVCTAVLGVKEGDAAAQRPDDQIYCQFSSLSSPTNPLATLKAAFHAPARLQPSPPRVPLSIVWPTAAEVCASVEGYGAGGALPSAQKNVDKVPREMLCRWTTDEPSSDFVTARHRAMGHIKTWTRVSGDGTTVRWSILTSANLSGGAWGNMRDGGRTLFIMHWELGVPVAPSDISPRTSDPDSPAPCR